MVNRTINIIGRPPVYLIQKKIRFNFHIYETSDFDIANKQYPPEK